MNVKRIGLLVAVAILTGVAGYFAGLFALLSATGLHEAEWAPVATLTGIGLAAGLGAGLTARISGRAILGLAAAAAGAGASVGFAVRATVDSFEWAILSGVILAVVVAFAARALSTNSSPSTG